MKQETDLAEKLFGNKRLETGSEKLTTTTIIGKALTDSENGYVEVEYDGNITYGDFQQNIVPTGPNVKAGDTVLITATGGVGKSMSVTNVQGWGDRLDKGVLEVSALIADKADIEYLEAEYAHITEGVIDNAKIDYADVNHLEANFAHITDGVIDNAKIGYADVEELDANFAHITDGVIDNAKIGYADVEELDANFAHITDGVIDNAKIGYADVENLDANYAHITNGTIDNAKIGYADVNGLNANYAHITNGAIDNAKIGYADVNGLNANYAHITNGAIDNAKIGYADVNDLEANYAQISFENVTNSWIENGVIRNGAIQNEMVQNVSASKLTAGTIDASKINVANLSADNLIVRRINGQPVVGGYTLIGTTSPGYSSKNPSQEGWYELSNGAFVLTQDTSVQEGKPYYQEGDEVALYDQAYIDSMKNQLNQRIDGAVETFTGTAVPTLTNYPYNTWYDTSLTPPKDERASHVGDIYFVTNPALDQDGYSYRFAYDNTSTSYMWVLIKDSDVTKALSDITDLQDFESETISWQEETDEGLTVIRQNHTSLSGVVDKTVKESVQLWFTKANTTAPSKPTAQVTSTSTDGNGWRTVVPAWNASYPNYYYCWQFKLADNTYAWSDVVRDIAMGESQGTSRSAQTTANANIKSSVQLWFTKANSTAPSKPTSQVTTNNAATGNAWNLAVPTYNASYPHYFYCYQQQKGDGTYQWSDVVYDKGTTEAMQKAQAALPSSMFTTFQSTTFKNLVDEVDEQSSTITSMSERIDKQVPIVSSSGERSITTEDAADLPLLTLEPVLGESVQNGNPTPSSPAYIMAVRPHNLITFNEFESGKIGDWQKNQNAVLTGHDGYLSIACGQTTSTPGAWCAVTLPAAGPYTVSLDARQRNSTTNSFRPTLFTASGTKVLDLSSSAISPGQTWAHYSYTATVNASGDMKFYIFTYGNSDTESGVEICNIVLSYGSTDRGYAPYGHIGIISSTGDASYLDMQGHELHSLNSTYRDSIEIDASGHAILKKRTLKLYCSELSVTDYGTNPKADNTLGLGVNATGGTFNKVQLGGKTSGYPLPISTIALGSTNGRAWDGGASNLNTVAGTTNLYPHNMYMCVSSTEYANAAAFQAALVGVLANEYVVTGLYEDYWEDVDLGYIDLPYVTDDAVVHVAAEISPVIGGSWWTKYGEETGRTVSNTVNSVKQTADANTLSITGLTTTTQSLRTDLDNLEIGGRNLFKDSETISTSSWTYENASNSNGVAEVLTSGSGNHRIYQMPANGYWSWEPGTEYVASIEAKCSGDNGKLQINPVGAAVTWKEFPLTTEWKRYAYVFTSGSGVTTGSMSFYNTGASGTVVYLRKPKLEKGNKATDWSPAPEDVQGSITTLESRSSKIEQTLDGFSSTVGAIVDETVIGTNILTGNALNPYNWTISAPSGANYTKTAYGTAGVKATFNTVSGFEMLYSPAITVTSGKKYTLSVEYTVGKDYIIASGKGGFGLSVYKAVPTSTFDSSNANFIARAQFFETETRVAMKATVTFTASSNTIYLGLNGGQMADRQTGLEFTLDKLTLVENISSRVSTAETSINQTADAIGLTASGTATIANPNLTPFYSIPYDDTDYWLLSSAAVSVADRYGWSDASLVNAPYQTAFHWRPKRMESISPGSKYTLVVELSEVVTSGGVYFMPHPNSGLAQIPIESSITNSTYPVQNGLFRVPMTARTDALTNTAYTALAAFCFFIPQGASLTCRVRCGLFEGEYSGPFKPFSDSALMSRVSAAESELSVQAGEISAKVSKDGVIASINASVETSGGSAVKISADKVQIDGTAVFNAISTKVDNAITGKGYATTSQAQGYANNAAANLSIGSRNLLIGSMDISAGVGEFGWVSNAAYTPTIEKVSLPGIGEAIHFVKNSTSDKFVPTIATRNVALVEFGKEYVYGIDIMFDAAVTMTTTTPNHYHAGANSDGGLFNVDMNYAANIDSNEQLLPAANTVVPANTWVHYEHRFKWKAGPDSSSRPYAAFRPFVFGSVLNTAAGGVHGWMRNPYLIEANSLGKTTWSKADEETPRPNLTPFFSFEPYNATAGQGGQYWSSNLSGNLVSLGDGWGRFTTTDNTSGSAVVYNQMRPKSIPSVQPETLYTLMIEFKNVTKTGGVYLRCPDGGQSGSAKALNGATFTSIDTPVQNGVYRKVFKSAASSTANYSNWFGMCTRVDAGAKATYDIRLSLYEGVYYGPYQPYQGSRILFENRIYYRSNSTTVPTAPTTLVTSSAEANATWTTKRIKYDSTYKYLYTTMQRKLADGTVFCDPVLLDDTTTVIDGGNILTNTISADKIKVSEINVGALGGSIGGTNLILYSNDQKLWGTYAPTGYSIANKVLLSENLVKGEKYTITIWGSQPTRSDKSSCWYAVYWGGGSISLVNVTIGSNGKGSMSFTAPNSSHADTSNALLSIYNTPLVGATGTTYGASITKMKLERGDRATDWSASPEDEIARRRAVYATCSTAAGTAAKVAACDKYQRYTGSMVTVTFSTANTATTPTLNVNSTGAATIKGYTGAALTEAEYKWAAGATITFTFDGTYWRMQDGGALQAKADAASSASTATSKATAASNSATAAANSATAASGSASTASDKATAASNSATAAAGSASTASTKATAASNSATAAANSATAAANSASTASDKATAASNSATAAANSATEAANRDTAFFGTCGTAAGTQAKVVACTNFKSTNLKTGTTIVVRCSTAQTYVSAKITLNVNSTGAKDVYAGDAVTSATNQVLWAANAMVTFVYNGSQWVIESDPRNWFGACTTAAGTQAKAGTLNMAGAVICKGTTVALQMSNANTHASPTLNVGSTAAKNLYIPGATTFPTVANGNSWFAGTTVNFVFDGQYWRLQIPDSAKFATALTSNGVMVHKQTDTTTGVQITDQVDIVKSGNSVATFAADKIQLGKNSTASSIELCGGKASITSESKTYSSLTVNEATYSGAGSSKLIWKANGSSGNANNNQHLNQQSTFTTRFGNTNMILYGVAEMEARDQSFYAAVEACGPQYTNPTDTSPLSKARIKLYTAPTSGTDVTALGHVFVNGTGIGGLGIGIAPVSLYDNESAAFSGSITLSETAANFSRFELFCKDNDGRYCYAQVWNPNGKTVNVTQTLSYGGNFYVKSRAFSISAKTINTASTSGTYHTGEVNAAGNNSGTSVDNIKIVKVLGYR